MNTNELLDWVDGPLSEMISAYFYHNPAKIDYTNLNALRALVERQNFTYCAYCGAEYPLDSVTSEQVTEHIRTCGAHPMRKLEEENRRIIERLKRVDILVEAAGEYIASLELDDLDDLYDKFVAAYNNYRSDFSENKVVGIAGLRERMVDCPPEFQKIVEENFWELTDSKSSKILPSVKNVDGE